MCRLAGRAAIVMDSMGRLPTVSPKPHPALHKGLARKINGRVTAD